jgi:hypothetical protein
VNPCARDLRKRSGRRRTHRGSMVWLPLNSLKVEGSNRARECLIAREPGARMTRNVHPYMREFGHRPYEYSQSTRSGDGRITECSDDLFGGIRVLG